MRETFEQTILLEMMENEDWEPYEHTGILEMIETGDVSLLVAG